MQKWEYCRLYLWGMTNSAGKGYSCNLNITYLSSNGVTGERLGEIDKQFFPLNPFEKALGGLGAMGWELVSIDYGLTNSLNGGINIGFNVNTNNAIAFFKRPVESGRAVDEPKLKI
jgi:hypothetical protein